MDTFNEQQLSMCETNELVNYIAELRVKNDNLEGEKDAHWNDWLNKEFGDELYPLSPSPEPDEFVEKINKLIKENVTLKQEVQGYQTTIPDYYDIATPDDIESVVDELREEIDKLKADIEASRFFALLAEEYKLLKAEINKLKKENEFKQGVINSQQKELDIEHIRYLDEKVKWSNRLFDICEYLGIDNDDTPENIIKEIHKLKCPVIYNRDMRCSQLDMRIGYSFLHDFFEPYVDDVEEKGAVLIVEDKEEYVWSEVSKCISNAIEGYIRNPVGELNYHIVDEVGECYTKLDTEGCFKVVEDE